MCLSDDSVVKTIGMGSIVVGNETRGKTNRICIMDVFHKPKLQANFLLVSKFLSNMLKVRFYVNKCIMGGANGE